MSRLTWQSLSQDTVSDLIDAYTLEPIGEGEAFVTCEECRRTYFVRTIVQVTERHHARCLGLWWWVDASGGPGVFGRDGD